MKNKLKNFVDFWHKIWGKLIAFIICGSIIALFIASFCLEKKLTLSVMNEWISLVVGMAALILGIISLFLSFYNVEQSNETQTKTIQIMNDVKESIQNKLDEMQKDIKQDIHELDRKDYAGNNIDLSEKMSVKLEGVE